VRTMKSFGMMSRASTKQIQCTKLDLLLESLYQSKHIVNYTDDGWVRLPFGSDWYPAKVACKKLGDVIYNEYLESSG